MNDLIIKSFEGNDLRILDKDGNPWFVALDICEQLDIKNVSDAMCRLNTKEKQIIDKNTIGNSDSIPGNPNILIISESGIYKLIFHSRKPEAEKFQDWVTEEVLPSIRKTGSYSFDKNYDELKNKLNILESKLSDIERIHGLYQYDKNVLSSGYQTIAEFCIENDIHYSYSVEKQLRQKIKKISEIRSINTIMRKTGRYVYKEYPVRFLQELFADEM